MVGLEKLLRGNADGGGETRCRRLKFNNICMILSLSSFKRSTSLQIFQRKVLWRQLRALYAIAIIAEQVTTMSREHNHAFPPPGLAPGSKSEATADVIHHENAPASPSPTRKWHVSLSVSGGGDTAMALFADAPPEPYTKDEERRLVRKVDLMILPYLAVCYAFFYIDKTTLSYAAIFGIREDLNLVGNQYSWLSSMFYFGFLVWAFPTSFLMQRLPVAKYLGFNIFLWGVLLIAQAGATNFTTLAVLRALSGAAEACSDPSFMLITSMWYTRRQQPVRIGLWYTANGFGIALGGLLGFGIGQIRGALPSWKYEFIVIGCLCCAWGIVLAALLPDSPVTARQLSERERRIAVERLSENQTGVENKMFKRYQLVEALQDPKTYSFFLMAAFQNTPNGGISNFGTLIIQGFGFNTFVTALMQVPYGIFIALAILSCVYLNDYFSVTLKKNTRIYFAILYTFPNIAGAFGLRFVPTNQHIARLWMYYLTGPYNASMVLLLSLVTANTAGHTKKVVTNAFTFLGYCVGGSTL